MFRSQLYDPTFDPERPEFYDEKTSSKDGYFISLKETRFFSTGSLLWYLYRSNYWQPFRSILCRLLMISYSLLLIFQTSYLFDEKLILLNISYLFLIVIDCFIVIYVRKGLEDRWCSLSILYFVCANSIPFWMLEINYGSFLSINIHNFEFSHHLESHYKQFTDSKILNNVTLKNGFVLSPESSWQESISKEKYSSLLEKHEALFCLILILCRIFIPQATLTWGAISSLSEFSFNTILDIYSTLNMCRDARLKLPKSIIIACFVISNGALFPIALNIFPDSESYDSLKISLLRRLTDNFYFRLVTQIIFADLPFLCLRLIILSNLKYVKKEMYYLIAKQIIIIFVKVTVMIYNWIKNFIEKNSLEDINELNNLNIFNI